MSADTKQEYFEKFAIINKRGLHARASAKFVKTAELYSAKLRVSKDGMSVGGTSIMGLMMLAASCGCSIDVVATGKDAKIALKAIGDLIGERFGEEC